MVLVALCHQNVKLLELMHLLVCLQRVTSALVYVELSQLVAMMEILVPMTLVPMELVPLLLNVLRPLMLVTPSLVTRPLEHVILPLWFVHNHLVALKHLVIPRRVVFTHITNLSVVPLTLVKLVPVLSKDNACILAEIVLSNFLRIS